jgi:hypothetical protein
MATQELKGKIFRKAGNGKGFLIEGNENWFNASEKVVPYLAKLNVGDEVDISYFKKGVKQEVTLIQKIEIKETPKKVEPETGEFTCEDCGATLKDGKYKRCWTCNKKSQDNPKVVEKTGTTKSKVYDEPKEQKEWKPKVDYNNPEKTAQIQRGNAGNMAAAVASSQQFSDPESATEFTILLAERFLEWLRAE